MVGSLVFTLIMKYMVGSL